MSQPCTHSNQYRYVNGWYCPDCKQHVKPDAPTASGNIHHDIYPYPSHGKHYYRYVVNQGHKVLLTLHIPGGAVGNPIADNRAIDVETAIATGVSPDSIVALIKSWQKGKRSGVQPAQ